MKAPILAAAICTASPIPVAADAESYSVDPKHTYASFEIDHLGSPTARGAFDRTSGRIELDRENNNGRIEITIDASSIDSGLAKHDEHLRAEAFFNVAVFPTIT